jgi:hypothetical protein
MEETRSSPFDQDIPKGERKSLASKVRDLLALSPRSVGEIADTLEVEPEVVVIALRELRARKRGRLRSTIRLGHVSWWWEPPVEPVDQAPREKNERAKAPKDGGAKKTSKARKRRGDPKDKKPKR